MWRLLLCGGALTAACGGSTIVAPDASDATADVALDASTDVESDRSEADAGGCEPWWKRMSAPIVPASGLADLAVFGRPPITLDALVAATCADPPSPMPVDDAGTVAAIVGDDGGHITVTATHGDVRMLTAEAPYTGALLFKDAMSSYAIAPGSAILRDASPIDPWSDATNGLFDAMYRALVATFLPSAPIDPVGTTCITSRKCVVASFGNTRFAAFRPLGVTVAADATTHVVVLVTLAQPP